MGKRNYVQRESKLVHANMTSVVKEPGVNFQGATHGDGGKHKRHHGGKKHHKGRYHTHHFMNS